MEEETDGAAFLRRLFLGGCHCKQSLRGICRWGSRISILLVSVLPLLSTSFFFLDFLFSFLKMVSLFLSFRLLLFLFSLLPLLMGGAVLTFFLVFAYFSSLN